MIPLAMAFVQGGAAVAGTGLGIFSNMMQHSALKRQARARVVQLQNNADIVTARGGFEQGKIANAVEDAVAKQANAFAAGNIDMTTGSPAILAAQSEAIGMQDQMLAGAKAVEQRADIYGQIAATWAKVDDSRRALALNTASSILGMAGKLAGIANGQGMFGGAGGATGGASTGAPMDITPKAPWSLY